MATYSVVGAYVPGTSALHQLDPRVKLALLCLWTAVLFAVQSWIILLGAFVGTVALAVRTGTPLGRCLSGLAPLAIVLVVMLAASGLRFDGSGAWVLAGSIGIDPAGLNRGAQMVARIAVMVLLSILLTVTTTVTALTEALLSLMAPLRRLHVPVDDLATMFSIALRFIPVCSEQLDRVVMAQRARGACVGEGGPIRRVVSWVPVMIPMFVGLFRRSDALAVSMAARCYRGEGRTCLTTLRMRPMDVAVLAAGIVLAVALVFVRVV